jgi:transketolase
MQGDQGALAPHRFDDLDAACVNAIRGIAMDAPQKARSGHPGTAMALAPLAHVLFSRYLRVCYEHLDWPDRDRFVLSNGHACILVYALLTLARAGLTVEDLKQFRQLGSRTPGHPERGLVPGIEVTTGPLGQGFANAVGMALAERHLRHVLGEHLVSHRTFVICSDGDLMEGISHEAASIAGHQRLSRLIAIYDDNRITIDGPTSLAYSDDVAKRFESYGFNVISAGEVFNDMPSLSSALGQAVAESEREDGRPTLIIVRTHIGWPAPHKTDTAAAHGEPLGEEEVKETKKILGLPDEPFYIPREAFERYEQVRAEREADHRAWQERLERASEEERHALSRYLEQEPEAGWEDRLPSFDAERMATRRAFNACLNAVSRSFPFLVAGSADLTGNTGVALKDAGAMQHDNPTGRQVHFGIREHGMAAAANGMAAHGGILPVVSTFLVFSDYMRPAIRLAALSRLRVIFVFSHDSIGLGEDGPTHQPVEHLASLRAIPGLLVMRPADANETAACLSFALSYRVGPVAVALTRQDVPVLAAAAGAPVSEGAYLIADTALSPSATLVASGSEVALCLAAKDLLEKEGLGIRVVSAPCLELFSRKGAAYRAALIPPDIPSIAVEAASPLSWHRFCDFTYCLDRFGESGPGEAVMRHFGFSPEALAGFVLKVLGKEADGASTGAGG